MRPQDSAIFQWLGVVVLAVPLIGGCIAVYQSYGDLWERLDAERAGDVQWLKTDRAESAAILAAIEDVKERLVILSTRLDTDPDLLYQLGLADGASLCQEKGATK